MPLIPINIPPGVVRNGTQFQVGTAGRWFDANLVRWSAGVMAPVGGWERRDSTVISGALRDLFAWRDNTQGRRLAIGSNEGLFVSTGGSTVVNITQTGFTAGRVDAISGFGYGFGPYGALSYGTARPDPGGALIGAAGWQFDNWGENLIALAPHDGRIVEWALDPATAAAVVANAPIDNRGTFVTPARHLVALGAGGDVRRVEWSSREDNTLWTPASTNTAGGFNLQTNGSIQAAIKVRGQTLILTTEDVHVMNFVGSPFVYGRERVSNAGGTGSPRSLIGFRGGAAWFAEDGFYLFDGAVRKLPSDVEDFVLSDINEQQFSKVIGGDNKEFSELWWFYPQSGFQEPNRYVAWNYRDNHWTIGALERTAYQTPGVYDKPILAATDGFVYNHEVGFAANGTPLEDQRFAESGASDIGNGDRVMIVTKLIPDEKTQGETQAVFKTRFVPNGPETTHGPFTLTDYTDVRFTGRQVALRIEGVADTDWRVGIPRIEAKEGGLR